MDFDALEYSDNVMDWAITNIVLNILELKKCFFLLQFEQE